MNGKEWLRRYWVIGIFAVLGLELIFWSSPQPVARGTTLSDLNSRGVVLQAATPTPLTNPTATPASQSGHGQNIFDVYCMPCHGDVGQGLTDEFRFREYPLEDTNCWKSGCHGPRPYDNGFTLPITVPVLIGPGALQRFPTAQNMYAFMRAAMPFNAPGSLSDEQYLELTAFLLEQNRFTPPGTRFDATSLQNIVLQPIPTPTPAAASPVAANSASSILLPGGILFLGLIVIGYLITRSRSAKTHRPD